MDEPTTSTPAPGPSSGTSAPKDACTAESPCPIPAVDPHPEVLFVLETSYERGSNATIRIKNVGPSNYTFAWTQQSCHLGIYDNRTGHRLWLGVCSDWTDYRRAEPGKETELFRWDLKECVEAGPWYGGCARGEAVAAGDYALRETFCRTQAPSECTRAGSVLRVA
jgi:hypothetical protein